MQEIHFSFLQTLTITQLEVLKEKISSLISIKDIENNTKISRYPVCPHCNYEITSRNGKTKNKNQRYICKNLECKKTFIQERNTLIFSSKKLKEKIRDFLILRLYHESTLRKIAETLNITLKTAFIWNTKINSILSIYNKTNKLSGIVEADQTLIKLNLKGTRPKNMPRKSYKRGTPRSRYEQIFIETGLDKNIIVQDILGVGKPKAHEIIKCYEQKIGNVKTFVTDGEKTYAALWKLHGFHREIVEKNMKSKNELYNMEKINSYHSFLKSKITKTRGISCRHLINTLNSYKVLFLLNKKYKNDLKNIIKEIMDFIFNQKIRLLSTEVFKIDIPLDIDTIFRTKKYIN